MSHYGHVCEYRLYGKPITKEEYIRLMLEKQEKEKSMRKARGSNVHRQPRP